MLGVSAFILVLVYCYKLPDEFSIENVGYKYFQYIFIYSGIEII